MTTIGDGEKAGRQSRVEKNPNKRGRKVTKNRKRCFTADSSFDFRCMLVHIESVFIKKGDNYMTINKSGTITLDFDMKKQIIDGFGVNINAKYWNNGQIKPVVDLLVDDLGATIFRLDHYGNANWVDPNNCGDASLLNAANYNKIYQTDEFQNALGLSLYLNSKGIEPYITVSGIVPQWMCEVDGITLSKYI